MAIKFGSGSSNGRTPDFDSGNSGSSPLPEATDDPKPLPGFDKVAYQRNYMRDKRSADKLGISVKEYRSQKKGQDK